MAYVFLLEDLAGNAQSELPGATGKTFSRLLSQMATARVTVPLWDKDADLLLSGDVLLKVIDVQASSRVNVFHGRLISAEEVGTADDQASVSATFADAFWPMMRRIRGKSTVGLSYGTPGSPTTASAAITDLVNNANSISPTGLRLGTVTTTTANVVTGPHFYKVIGELIAQLAGTLDGPDWRVEPIDAVASTNPATCYYGELTVAPAIGQTRLDQPFEYGDGRLNVRNYRRTVALDGVANLVSNLPAGYPDIAAGSVVTSSDAASQAARGLLETVVQADLTDATLRQALVDLHLLVRKNPRQTITFDPVNDLSFDRLPRLRVDYDVGDVVPFRASIKQADGSIDKRINILARVYGVEVAVDEKGVGQPTITVTPST